MTHKMHYYKPKYISTYGHRQDLHRVPLLSGNKRKKFEKFIKIKYYVSLFLYKV